MLSSFFYMLSILKYITPKSIHIAIGILMQKVLQRQPVD